MSNTEMISDNQTDFTEEDAVIEDVASMLPDIGEASENIDKKEGSTDGKAPEVEDSASDKEKTDDKAKEEQLLRLDGIEFDATSYGAAAKAKGYWDGEKVLNVNNIFKQNVELEKKMTDLNIALGNYKTQTTSLQSQMSAKDTPKTRDEIKETFHSEYAKLESVYKIYRGAFDRAEDGEDKDGLRQMLVDMEAKAKEMDNEYQETLRDYDKTEILKEAGVIKDASTITAEKAKIVANENFDKFLAPEQIADKEYIGKLLGPAQAMFHKMASAIFPNVYDAGNPNSEKSLEAVYRVMMDEDAVKMAIDFGTATIKATESEQKLKDAEKSGYDRGLQDGMKGVKAKTPDSASSPVKNMTVTKNEDSASIDEVVSMMGAQ